MSEPATQAMLWDVVRDINAHIDEKHKSLRGDLNHYTEALRARVEDHEKRLVAMKTEKDTEDKLSKQYRDDRWNALRYRAMIWGTAASLLVTIGTWAIDAFVKSHGWIAP
jgi:hypothetical protein